MRHVLFSMGMPISIDIPECKDKALFDSLEKRFHDIDARFSTYKEGSEVCRFQRGEIAQDNLSDEFQLVKAACAHYEQLTDGYFSAYYKKGLYDPTGFVKGWAIHEVGLLIKKAGYGTYLINAAGDIEAASNGDKTWHIGIQHPSDRTQTIGTITLRNGAVATSGIYERGTHIFDPHTHVAQTDIVSATTWGKDVIAADAFATAAIAMGITKALPFIKEHGYNAILIDADNTLHMTPDTPEK